MKNYIINIFGVIIVWIAIFFQETALILYEFGKILINTNKKIINN